MRLRTILFFCSFASKEKEKDETPERKAKAKGKAKAWELPNCHSAGTEIGLRRQVGSGVPRRWCVWMRTPSVGIAKCGELMARPSKPWWGSPRVGGLKKSQKRCGKPLVS